MKKSKILMIGTFVLAIGSAFAFKSPNRTTADITFYYKNTSNSCVSTTCSNTVKAELCAHPSDFSTGFYSDMPNLPTTAGCTVTVSAYRPDNGN